MNSTRYPGADELCDGIDNDCDDEVDDGIVDVTCYRDRDSDGWGNEDDTVVDCSCPDGYIPPRSDAEVDCRDTGSAASSVNPGQFDYFPVGYCIGLVGPSGSCIGTVSFDYNCDKTETPRWTRDEDDGCGFVLRGGCEGYWLEPTAPRCGERGTWRSCAPGTSFGSCVPSFLRPPEVTQECR
jgi:hypothetical protein